MDGDCLFRLAGSDRMIAKEGRRVVLVRVFLFLIVAAPAAISGAAAQTSLRALLIEYRCAVVDRLDRIHENPAPTDFRDRFLAVTLPEHPHGYVQCIFFDSRRKILCEASSGFYFDPPGRTRTFRLSREAVAALGALGFSTDDSQGNFRLERELGAQPDFNALADLMLKALHDGYGARAESKLRFNAPFAPRPTTKCIPVS